MIQTLRRVASTRRHKGLEQAPADVKKRTTGPAVRLIVDGAEDEIRTRDPVLGKDVLYR